MPAQYTVTEEIWLLNYVSRPAWAGVRMRQIDVSVAACPLQRYGEERGVGGYANYRGESGDAFNCYVLLAGLPNELRPALILIYFDTNNAGNGY